MSEPRPDTPDTGAGTPLTAEDRLESLVRHRHSATVVHVRAGDLRELLAAARSRPATDPAGLDVERLARLVVSYADLTHAVVVEGRDWREIADEWGHVVEECRGYLARLSVADRPGPEERLRDG